MIRRLVTKASALPQTSEIPQPRGLPLIGTTLALIYEGSGPKLHEYIDKRHKQLGAVFRDKIGPISAVFVADPEEMRSVFAQEGKYPAHVLPEAWIVYNREYGCSRGLFFMDGEEWFHYRKIMNRLLLRGNSDMIERACVTVSEELVGKLRAKTPELEKELYRWSLNVVTAVLLGAEGYKATRERLNGLLETLALTVNRVFETTVKLQLLPATLAAKFKLPAWKRFVLAVDNALTTSNQLVATLLDDCELNGGVLEEMVVEEKLQRSEIVKLVADLILAAGDTTAYTMEWLLYLIAKNRDVQQKLRNDPNPNILLKNCLRETLRLYPVAPFITRYLPSDTTISGRYKIPKGTLVIMSLYTIGRNANYFKNPEVFNPDRWLRSSGSTMQQVASASLPFAMGARSCIGRKIAETQLQQALLHLVRNFDIKLCDDHEEVEMVLKMVAVPKEPVRLQFCNL